VWSSRTSVLLLPINPITLSHPLNQTGYREGAGDSRESTPEIERGAQNPEGEAQQVVRNFHYAISRLTRSTSLLA
jgi:hypothetical protein